MNLNVNEIFYSLQGEGGRSGQPSIFIRLAKCNLSCSFCDTDFERGVKMTTDEILRKIEPYGCKWIIWTGGEPTLQLNDALVALFKEKGYCRPLKPMVQEGYLRDSTILPAVRSNNSRKSGS